MLVVLRSSELLLDNQCIARIISILDSVDAFYEMIYIQCMYIRTLPILPQLIIDELN